jgi:hypothetical protein
MKAVPLFVMLCCIVALSSGCASITGTGGQPITVESHADNGEPVADVNCKLANAKGMWYVKTPGSVMITRSNDDMQVTCEKSGLPAGTASVTSATKGAMFGNILFGGVVGAVIDHNSGAAYEYPGLIRIRMGAFTQIGPPDQSDSAPAPAGGPRAPMPTPTRNSGNTSAMRAESETAKVEPASSAPAVAENTGDRRAAPDLSELQDLLPQK